MARLDAELLLAHALGRARAWIIAHPEAHLPNAEKVTLALRRRAAGEPLAYLVGQKAFHGLDFAVDARVLIPRPETETLVEWALELLAGPLGFKQMVRVLDLGTGSGAIALAIKAARPCVDVTAVDLSDAALEVAQINATHMDLPITFLSGDWWRAFDGAVEPPRFELIVANPPYIAEGDPHLPGLASEPAVALVSGPDGLDAIRTIVAGAVDHLMPGGWLLIEHGYDQADDVAGLMMDGGLRAIDRRVDLDGVARCCGGRAPQ